MSIALNRADARATGRVESPRTRDWLLLLRFALLNLLGLALALGAWHQELIGGDDPTRLYTLIGLVFLGGLAVCAYRIWQVSRELNEAAAAKPKPVSRSGRYLALAATLDGQGRANLTAGLRLALVNRLNLIRQVAGILVMLGLIGTVIGFMMALKEVRPDAVADVAAVGPMVSGLIAGMGVALGTTLMGSILNIWLMLCHRLLEDGTVRLLTRLTERAEAEGGQGHGLA